MLKGLKGWLEGWRRKVCEATLQGVEDAFDGDGGEPLGGRLRDLIDAEKRNHLPAENGEAAEAPATAGKRRK